MPAPRAYRVGGELVPLCAASGTTYGWSGGLEPTLKFGHFTMRHSHRGSFVTPAAGRPVHRRLAGAALAMNLPPASGRWTGRLAAGAPAEGSSPPLHRDERIALRH